ncbi:MAG: LacI family DNA-binding transcriptional regulator, partial [Angelakisella sp.]
MATGKPTLNQVAALAGVSSSAASMILNNRVNVSFSEDAITRVQQAAEQLGYIRRADRATEGRSIGNHTI